MRAAAVIARALSLQACGVKGVGIYVYRDAGDFAFQWDFGPRDPAWRCPDPSVEVHPGVPTWMRCEQEAGA